MRFKDLAFGCVTAALLFHAGTAFCDTIKTLRFNELPQTHVPPTLALSGVRFDFTEDPTIPTEASLGADFGVPFSGQTTNLGSTVLLGNDPGILTLTFDHPTTLLSFQAASAVTTPNVFEVRVFDASAFPLRTSEIVLNPVPCIPPGSTCDNLAQGSFIYTGSAMKTATLDFSSLVPGATPAAFAIGALSYMAASVGPAVPEPSEWWLLLCGLAFFCLHKTYRFIRR
jgi:hypothetical protein